MSNNLILDFPVLKEDSGDFEEDVKYKVEARQDDGVIKIKHTLEGRSFISHLVENGEAEFSVLLLYRDSSERLNRSCQADQVNCSDGKVVAEQTICMKFSYAPEITPSIVILKEKKIDVDSSCGLTEFWKPVESFVLPEYSRLALGPKLGFTTGNVSNLMQAIIDETLGHGEMKVDVNEIANEGEPPVSLFCGKHVYDELRRFSRAEPSNAAESMRFAIVTQALCAVYAYMQNLSATEDYEPGGVLLAHLEQLEDKTGENWENDGFNPSLAATKMYPYALAVLDDEIDDD